MRAAAWIVSGALLVVAGVFVGYLYVTVPAVEVDIVLISGIAAALAVAVLALAVVYVLDEIRDRRWDEDADEHVRPLRTGSRAVERAMFQFHRTHGLILQKRASLRTRRIAKALDSLPVRHPWLKAIKRQLRAVVAAVTYPVRALVTAVRLSRQVPAHQPRHAAPAEWDDPMPPPAPPVDMPLPAPMPPMGADGPEFLTAPVPEPVLPPLPDEGTAYPEWPTGQFAALVTEGEQA